MLKKGLASGRVPSHSMIATNRSSHADIDDVVYAWFRSVLRLLVHGNRYLFRDVWYKHALCMKQKKRGADNFKASDGWFSRWRWRHAVLKSTILHRDVGGR